MGPPVDPIAVDETLPPRTGVVIIGGGIIGAATAFFLARAGVPVVICEKGQIAGEQSSRNAGWCRQTGRDSREIPLIIESLRLWPQMNTMVEGETGFRTTGVMYLCDTDEEIARRERWLEIAKQYQLDSRMIGPDEIAALLPGMSKPSKAALYTPSDGRAEPQKAAPAIAAAARRAGAVVLTNCAVRSIETKGGRVSAAITEKGRIACDTVVLAGGAWSSLFCGNLGLRLPQLKVRVSMMRTEPLPGGPEVNALGDGFLFRGRLDGGYTFTSLGSEVAEIVPDSFRYLRDFLPLLRQEHRRLTVSRRFLDELRYPRRWKPDEPSPFESNRILDPEPIPKQNRIALKNLKTRFPVFNSAKIAQEWAGMIDVTPDIVPIISPVDSIPGFIVATGFSGHGFGIGPAAGKLVSQLPWENPHSSTPRPSASRASSTAPAQAPNPASNI